MKVVFSEDLKRRVRFIGLFIGLFAVCILIGTFAPYKFFESNEILLPDGLYKTFWLAFGNGALYVSSVVTVFWVGRTMFSYLLKNIAFNWLERLRKVNKLQKDINAIKCYLEEGSRVFIVSKNSSCEELPEDQNIIKEIFDFNEEQNEITDILTGKVIDKLIRADWSDATRARLMAENDTSVLKSRQLY